MITSIVFDVDDTIYDQQAPYRIAMEKCFPDFDMTHMNQAYIRFRHYSDIGFPRVMTGVIQDESAICNIQTTRKRIRSKIEVDNRIFPFLAL